MDINPEELIKLGSLVASGLVGYGVLQGKVKGIAERLGKVENKIENNESQIHGHSVSIAEARADMKYVVNSLATIEQKIDKILSERSV